MSSLDPHDAPTTAPPPAPRRFLRSHDDRVIGGVAGGLGRAFGVDPIIFRIALGALALAGGVGLVAYGLALLVVPADDGTGQPAARGDTAHTVAVLGGGALLVVAGILALASNGVDGGWLFPVALVVGAGYLVVRARGGEGLRGAPLSRLVVLFAIGLAALAGAAVLFWGAAWTAAAGGGVVVAGAVIALGAVAILAALRGDARARWLVLPALLLAAPAAVVSAADIKLDGGVGEQTYRPTGSDPIPGGYRLGAGELVVDLRGVDWHGGRRVPVRLDVGVGHAVVLVPASVCVASRSDVRVGYDNVLGRDAGGIDVRHDVPRRPPTGTPTLALDVHMGIGVVEVRHLPNGQGPAYVGADADPIRARADRACGAQA